MRYRFRGKGMLNLLMMLPLIVPAVVSALGYYGFLGLARLAGTRVGMIIAHSVLSIPVAFLAIAAALKGFDRNLERAAMSAGAGPLRTFFWVTLPVLRPGILVGALFAFLHSFNEAVVAIFIAGRDAATLPKKMFESIRLESDPVIAVVSTLLTGAVLLGVLISLLFRRKPAQSLQMQLDPLVNPRSVAIVGATDRARPRPLRVKSLGAIGFSGTIYPVNPEVPDRPQSRLLSEPDRPAGGARHRGLQHPQRRSFRSRCGSR